MAVVEARPDGTVRWRPDGSLPADGSLLAIELGDCGNAVAIDLTGYHISDTSDLAVLINGVRQYRGEGGDTIVIAPEPATRNLLESAGLERIAKIVGDIETAAKELGHQSG